MDYFFGLLINGVAVGAIYSMVAMGFVLIYKASRVVNFAQGELLMIGAYICLDLMVRLNMALIPAFFVTLMFMAVLAVLIERLVLRKMMGAPVMSIVMVTIGLGIVLRSVVMMIWGPGTQQFPGLTVRTVDLGFVRVDQIYVYALFMSVVFMGLFGAFFQFTRTGLVMRAVASSPVAAQSVGVPLSRVFALAWIIAAVVSAAGGVLTGQIAGLTPDHLAAYGVRVFPAVILGGLDSIVGATIAGVVIGVMEQLGGGYLRNWTGLSGLGTVMPFIVLILILWIRPNGLFGTREVERI